MYACICVSIYLSIYISILFYSILSIYLSIYLSNLSIYLSICLSVLSKDKERERTTVGNVDLKTWTSSCMHFVHHPCLQCGNTTCARCKQMQECEASVLGLSAVICNTYVTLSTQSTCKILSQLVSWLSTSVLLAKSVLSSWNLVFDTRNCELE